MSNVPNKPELVKQWLIEHFPMTKIKVRDIDTKEPWFVLTEGNREAEIDFNRGEPFMPVESSLLPPDWFFNGREDEAIKAYITEPDYFKKLADALKQSGFIYHE